MEAWDPDAAGVLTLPSGLRVRGRGRRRPALDPPATVTLALTWRRPPEVPEEWWVRWPDFAIPADRAGAAATLRRAHDALATERVEITCAGGVGRTGTGTGLAALAVLDGLSPHDAVAFVRERYHPRAVENPWQRWFLQQVTDG